MKKIIRLNENDLESIIKKVLGEQANISATAGLSMGDKENLNPKNLKLGDGGNRNPKKSEDVKKLQKRLMDLGFLKTKSMTPTGYFGNLTKDALDRYNGTTAQPQQKEKIIPQPEKTKQKSTYKLTPRIDQELNFIKQRRLDDKPFFIYDPQDNLIYLFNKGGVFVDYSQVIDGADKQRDAEPLTHEKWCELSGLDSTPYKCTDKNTKTKKNPFYSVLANISERFIPKGIYSISFLTKTEGYQGTLKNDFRMVDDKGKPVAAAIHGIPNLPDRLKASADLELLLKKDISSGRVPEKYLNNIKAITNANKSFGCIGVPTNFIDNPKVQNLSLGARVFVMGEGKDFLVQNADEYFKKLSGDGENCVNPMSLANKMSIMA